MPLEFVTGTSRSVRLRTEDINGPIMIIVELKALESRFQFPSHLVKLRVEMVMANLDAFEGTVRRKLARGEWTRGLGAKSRQIVIGPKDIENTSLRVPNGINIERRNALFV